MAEYSIYLKLQTSEYAGAVGAATRQLSGLNDAATRAATGLDDNTAAARARTQAALGTVASLKQEIAALKEQQSGLQAGSTALKENQAQIRALTAALNPLQTEERTVAAAAKEAAAAQKEAARVTAEAIRSRAVEARAAAQAEKERQAAEKLAAQTAQGTVGAIRAEIAALKEQSLTLQAGSVELRRYQRQIQELNALIAPLKSNVGALEAVFAGLGGYIGLLGVGQAAATLLQLGEAQTKAVAVLSTVSDDADELRSRFEALNIQQGDLFTTTESLTAAYEAVSAGFSSAADAAKITASAQLLAKGGLGGSAEAVGLLSTVLNAYGLNADSAAKVTDILAGAIAFGQLKAKDLSASLGNVIPIAAQSGIKVEELSAAIAILSKGGVNASRSTDALRQAIAALLAPGPQASKVLAELGLQNIDLTLKNKGLAAAFDELSKATGNNVKELRQIIPDVTALTGILPLVTDRGKELKEVTKELGSTTGTAAEQARRGATTFEQFGTAASNAATRIGRSIESQLNGPLGAAIRLLDDFVAREAGLEKLQELRKLNPGIQIAGDDVRSLALPPPRPDVLKQDLESQEAFAGALLSTPKTEQLKNTLSQLKDVKATLDGIKNGKYPADAEVVKYFQHEASGLKKYADLLRAEIDLDKLGKGGGAQGFAAGTVGAIRDKISDLRKEVAGLAPGSEKWKKDLANIHRLEASIADPFTAQLKEQNKELREREAVTKRLAREQEALNAQLRQALFGGVPTQGVSALRTYDVTQAGVASAAFGPSDPQNNNFADALRNTALQRQDDLEAAKETLKTFERLRDTFAEDTATLQGFKSELYALYDPLAKLDEKQDTAEARAKELKATAQGIASSLLGSSQSIAGGLTSIFQTFENAALSALTKVEQKLIGGPLENFIESLLGPLFGVGGGLNLSGVGIDLGGGAAAGSLFPTATGIDVSGAGFADIAGLKAATGFAIPADLAVPHYASGAMGIDQPTLAIVGEGGEPEDIVPHSKRLGYAQSLLGGGGRLAGTGGATVQVFNINIAGDDNSQHNEAHGLSAQEFVKQIQEQHMAVASANIYAARKSDKIRQALAGTQTRA
ncbi:phage tail tape measure protein [Gloeobacter kilaueensis]|uniref:Phage tail tape measure protein, TP901 family n=1 Tax=Gloeobacter kilaueensis (strain ATCC BAA-2537 / CCAP 1431/1 / ULC 316 / JS1) TaxID=1183438 RepID=U5QCR4_GLOK1|nr:phage tail tape measure protein [Gloeobacter kilaueensis]AGY56638.1 phage tail tape measure protein, TP901 family [Gloeobacter kilaueensis JS1]